MANPVKGEVDFELDGRTFTLSYSIDSLCVLEDLLDLSVTEIGRQMATAPRLGFLRAVLWAGLRDHHPGLEVVQVGEMITQIGFEKLGQLIAVAYFKSFPTAEKKPAHPPKPPTRKPAAGSGKSSSKPGANSRSAVQASSGA